jgi:hypothetical protein
MLGCLDKVIHVCVEYSVTKKINTFHSGCSCVQTRFESSSAICFNYPSKVRFPNLSVAPSWKVFRHYLVLISKEHFFTAAHIAGSHPWRYFLSRIMGWLDELIKWEHVTTLFNMSATEGTAGGTCCRVRGLSDFEFLRQESAAVRWLPYSPMLFRVNILTVSACQIQLYAPWAQRSLLVSVHTSSFKARVMLMALLYANLSVFYILWLVYPLLGNGSVNTFPQHKRTRQYKDIHC